MLNTAAADAIGLFKSREDVLPWKPGHGGRPLSSAGRLCEGSESRHECAQTSHSTARAGPGLAPFLRAVKERLRKFCEKWASHHFSARIRVHKAQHVLKLTEG